MTSLLLVEDDEFKASDVMRILLDVFVESTFSRAASVNSALRAISSSKFDLLLLDMSLPTFDMSGPGGGGSPQGQGGIEVLRLAKQLALDTKFVVITQYPDIEIDRADVPLGRAPKLLSSKFGLDIRACLLYEFDSDRWRIPFRDALQSLRLQILD
jgi:CheY-like chemotaxis protein